MRRLRSRTMTRRRRARRCWQRGELGDLPYAGRAASLEVVRHLEPECGRRSGRLHRQLLPLRHDPVHQFARAHADHAERQVLALLFEQNSWFHVVPLDGRDHPKGDALNPTWFGNSIGKWDGDTLIIDTVGFNGYTRLDTNGHPHSDQLHLVQTFRRTDMGHIEHTVTVDDPKFYTKPWKNERTFTLMNAEVLSIRAEENNRSLWEGGSSCGCRRGRRRNRNALNGPPAPRPNAAHESTTIPGMWCRTDARATSASVIVAAVKPKKRAGPPASSAHDPTDGLSTPPMRPKATAVPTPVARTDVG